MKIRLKRVITGMMLVCVLAIVNPYGLMTSWAANTKIAFSDPSVMVGNEVTVTMKLTSDTALGKANVTLSYDPNALEFISGTGANGGTGVIKLLGTMEAAGQKEFKFSLKFKALQAGSTPLTVTSQEIYDADSQVLTLDKQGSSNVKVTSPATSSKDATLKSLKISPGTLTPEFTPAGENYTASVDGNTTNLVVNAVAANAGATVSLQGAEGLKTGENKVVVKVTAEDRQTIKNYTITVTKLEGGETVPTQGDTKTPAEAQLGDVKVIIEEIEYGIAVSFNEKSLPEGFEASAYEYKGAQVMAGKGLEKDLTLLYLQDASGDGGFYIYNEQMDSWTPFVQIEISAKSIVIIPLDSEAVVPEGLEERPIDIDGNRVIGWTQKSEADSQYCVFYGLNWNGEKNFYRYDLIEKTIQRYFASGVSNEKYVKLATDYNNLTHDYNIQFYILIGAGVIALILLIIIIILLKRGGGTPGLSRHRNRYEEDEDAYSDDEPKYEDFAVKIDLDDMGTNLSPELSEKDSDLDTKNAEIIRKTMPYVRPENRPEAKKMIDDLDDEGDDFEFVDLNEKH